MLGRNGESGNPFLGLNFEEKVFSILLSNILSAIFCIGPHDQVMENSFYFWFTESVYHEQMLNFSNVFSAYCQVFFLLLQFINIDELH